MKKIVFLLLFFMIFCSFGVHKFYVSIYQINYNQKAKRIEITTRIFVDDLNAIMYKKYKQQTHFGESNEKPEDLVLMQKYLSEKVVFMINNQPKKMFLISKELEDNSLICYFKIDNINKIKTFEIKNTALLDLSTDQQNIIQSFIYGKKESQLLTFDHPSVVLEIEK
jgi:hypothetical protein